MNLGRPIQSKLLLLFFFFVEIKKD